MFNVQCAVTVARTKDMRERAITWETQHREACEPKSTDLCLATERMWDTVGGTWESEPMAQL